MLAGRLPFSAATPWEWATKHMTVAPTPLSVTPSGAPIPETMVYAIMRSLSKDPDDRFSSTRQFYEAMAIPPTNPEGMGMSGGYGIAPASMLAGGVVTPHMMGSGMPPATQPAGGGAVNPLATTSGPGGEERRGNTQIGAPTPGGMAAYPPAGSPAYAPPHNGLASVPPSAAGPRRGRGGAGIVIAIVVGIGLLAAGGIVFALTRPHKHGTGRDKPPPSAIATTDSDAGTTPTDDRPHMPPLIDTSLPSLPIHGDTPIGQHTHHVDAGDTPTPDTPPTPTSPSPPPPPGGDPHSCKSARSLQAKMNATTNPSMKLLSSFNHERQKCITEGGHL